MQHLTACCEALLLHQPREYASTLYSWKNLSTRWKIGSLLESASTSRDVLQMQLRVLQFRKETSQDRFHSVLEGPHPVWERLRPV